MRSFLVSILMETKRSLWNSYRTCEQDKDLIIWRENSMQVDLKWAVDWFIDCVGGYGDEEFCKSLSEIVLDFSLSVISTAAPPGPELPTYLCVIKRPKALIWKLNPHSDATLATATPSTTSGNQRTTLQLKWSDISKTLWSILIL